MSRAPRTGKAPSVYPLDAGGAALRLRAKWQPAETATACALSANHLWAGLVELPAA